MSSARLADTVAGAAGAVGRILGRRCVPAWAYEQLAPNLHHPVFWKVVHTAAGRGCGGALA
eukprot:5668824-Heterocapsa_arctica.AAC.1